MRENLIEVRNLRFAYQGKPVLKDISFDVATGDTLSIVAGGMNVKVRLKTSSPEAVRERRAFYVKAGLMIAGVIVVFALIGRKMRR